MPTQSSSEFELWFRRHRSAASADQDAPHLLCLPHAGGAASWFAPLSAALAPGVRVLSVQYPGRQDRYTEPCVDSIAEFADRIYQAFDHKDTANAPFALFGHSMGAVIAFELARRFESAGRPPAVLFASGRRAPSTYRAETGRPRDDQGLVEELAALSGTDASILQDPEILDLVLPALRADFYAVETYRRPEGAPLSSPIVAMIGDRDPEVTVAEAEAWAPETSAGFELRVYPGGHFYLADRVAEVAAVLAARLRG